MIYDSVRQINIPSPKKSKLIGNITLHETIFVSLGVSCIIKSKICRLVSDLGFLYDSSWYVYVQVQYIFILNHVIRMLFSALRFK